MPGRRKSVVEMVEQALEQLAGCGIRLRPGVLPDDIYLSETFLPDLPLPARLLMSLGWPLRRPPHEPLCDSVLRLDTECVCNTDTYLRLAEEACRLAGDSLPLRDVRSEVDFQAETAWLSFTLDGEAQHWKLEYNEDWLDPCFFSRLSQQMVRRKSPAQFYRPEVRTGQEEVLVCLATDQKARLEQLTGLKFAPLL